MPSMRGFGAATATAGKGDAQGAAGAPAGNGVQNPITWVFVMAVLVVLAIFFAHKVGKAEEFSNIRGSFYNVFYVTFVAIVGILMLKVVFSKFDVPGLSAAIQSV